ncbi:hypothetical protein QC764_0110720 [Podospora pseudoanserina]|uniref:Uncharacterized protein n=1 Tax=Podospora pseudoanserina TaxID=2609844 RepID=A0ABR0HJA5_9PEZI|nr:hypothetical protein QC764_0110720 [Podospora pseudoanserina]
MHCAYVSRP